MTRTMPVIPPPAASSSVTMPCGSETVGFARMWAAWQLDLLLPWGAASLIDDVQIVVSELVTNALRAECRTVTIDLAHNGGTIRIGVHDDAPGVPALIIADADATHGRGLHIVAAISTSWGVARSDVGKQVWATFAVPAPGETTVVTPVETPPNPADPVDSLLLPEPATLRPDAVILDLLEQVRRIMQVDTTAILLFDESHQFLVAAAARGLEEEVRQGARVRAGLGFAGRIATERRPVVLDEVTSANVVNPLLLRKGIASMVGVPIEHDHQVLGVMHVGSLTPRRFTQLDIATLERGAARAGQVLVRHRAFIDRTAATALQNSLTPRLPEIIGLDLAARYVPGSQYGVGGDWYDVFRLPSGLVGIVIGDVMGHGLTAATIMGRLRSALRAYAIEDDDPASVLTRLDRKFQHFEPGHIATVLYIQLDPRTGDVSVSSAGHLPPLVAGGDQVVRQVDVPIAPPIGVPGVTDRRCANARLSDGETLLAYTDGLVERRTSDLDDELQRLRAALRDSAPSSADRTCADVMTAMIGDREPEDDISLLAVLRPAALVR